MRGLAVLAGLAFVGLGVASFVPALSPQGLLFGVFAVDPSQNMFHIATGILGVLLGASGESLSRTWFRLVGIVYALMVVIGLFARSGEVMGMTLNSADQMLHAAIAWVALYLGFLRGRAKTGRYMA